MYNTCMHVFLCAAARRRQAGKAPCDASAAHIASRSQASPRARLCVRRAGNTSIGTPRHHRATACCVCLSGCWLAEYGTLIWIRTPVRTPSRTPVRTLVRAPLSHLFAHLGHRRLGKRVFCEAWPPRDGKQHILRGLGHRGAENHVFYEAWATDGCAGTRQNT